MPERIKIAASPAALVGQSRAQQIKFSFPFRRDILLEGISFSKASPFMSFSPCGNWLPIEQPVATARLMMPSVSSIFLVNVEVLRRGTPVL